MNAIGANRERDATPAVGAVDTLHDRATAMRCSDIHIEPRERDVRVRFRIDGALREVEAFESPLGISIVSRLKILGGMDIAERRQPQDGRYTIKVTGGSVDARVSSVPTTFGEKLVVRLFDRRSRTPSLDELGMPAPVRATFEAATRSISGFVVVCGPTASGKSTTLYAALAALNSPERNLCTIEDPIEQLLPGVTQIHINAKAGSTFHSALRALLRQDPDVLMIGEMRDSETAQIAVGAAMSGRLVLSTLHSSDAPRAIDRLVELGVPRTSLASALSAVLGQRLVRRACLTCAPAARACVECGGTGYRGRTGLFEILRVDEDLRDAIAAGSTASALRSIGSRSGYRPLAEDGASKLAAGVTTAGELSRITGIAATP